MTSPKNQRETQPHWYESKFGELAHLLSTDQLTGLQMAIALLAQIGDDDSDRAIAAVHAAADERDELRAKYDELLVALHCIGAALGIPEGDRSPYSVTCGVLERVNRLAEIEAQEPGKQRQGITLNAAQLRHALDFAAPDFDKDDAQRMAEVTIGWHEVGEVLDDDGHPDPAGYVAWLTEYPEEGCIPLLESWESATVPAQAVPDADGARFRWLCEDHSDRETRERCRSLIDRLPAMSYSDAVMSIDAAMAAALEAAR